MIKAEKIIKSFDGFTALNELSLNVKKGSIYGLVGVNGSGKTTIIKHLAGVYRQDKGSVLIDGIPVYDNAGIKERVGYIPDDLYFFKNYSIKSLKPFYRGLYKNFNADRCNALTELFKLDPKRRLSKFSKGMLKQAAFIFTMSIMPDVLLLDEPIDGLDPIVRKLVLQQIVEDVAERGLTVLISSHNLKEMEGICDSIGIVKKGRMITERDLDDLKSDVHKVQVALPQDTAANYEGLNILHSEERGSVALLIIRGAYDEVESKIRRLNPLVFDILPLTFEEIFIYETEGEFDEIPY
jgi:ABC-2 type transport system ATP-binding protein